MITIDEFKKGEITIGKILAVELVEGSDKLLKLTVDFAEEKPRTIVSGIRKYFEAPFNDAGPQSLTGVKCAFCTNLEPRLLMGLTSEGMILAVSGDNFFSLLTVHDGAEVGARVK
jgi:methionyl-tRNA synthetase